MTEHSSFGNSSAKDNHQNSLIFSCFYGATATEVAEDASWSHTSRGHDYFRFLLLERIAGRLCYEVTIWRLTTMKTQGLSIQLQYRRTFQGIINSEIGANIVEYALVLVFFGVILVGATSFFQSSSEQFYESSTDGLLIPYPPNYIPAPTPTPVLP